MWEHTFVPSHAASLHADFQRAVSGGHVTRAEAAARTLGALSLGDALALVLLYAEREPAKWERAALRWHARLVAERRLTLLQAQIALAALADGGEAARRVLRRLSR